MRLIDADALKHKFAQITYIRFTADMGQGGFEMFSEKEIEEIIDNAPAVETMNPDYQIKVNIPEEETQKLIEQLQRYRPCILPESEFTDDDIQELIKENFNIGYEMAKNKYARPQGEWITNGELDSEDVCSVCKKRFWYRCMTIDLNRIEDIWNFCPNCGSDMRKGGAE